ncbi:MAG TPA: PQQ-binding-like beta-propeller repeat protein [Cellulomonas sp.]
MGAGREAMQDVETTEVEAPPSGDPDAARRRRVARARRLARRAWPVPVLIVLALVASRIVLDARERDLVEQRQTVDGVLGDLDHDLPAVAVDDQEGSGTILAAGDLEITLRDPGTYDGTSTDRTLIATRDGEQVWTYQVDPAGTVTPTVGFDTPECFAADDPITGVVCLVTDTEKTDLGDGSWTAGAQDAARLVRLDAGTGAETDQVDLPRYSSVEVADGVLYLASVSDDGGTLTVTAQDAATGTERWRTEQDLAATTGSTAQPGITLSDGLLLVRASDGYWAIDPAGGSVRFSGDGYVLAARTGLLAASGSTTLFFADDGTELFSTTAAQSTALLSVDDGSLPDLELMADSSGGTTALVAVDPGAGSEVWRTDDLDWFGTPLILLDGVLYGSGYQQVWALDAATGVPLWAVDLTGGAAGTVLTDGEYLFTTVWSDPTTVVLDVDSGEVSTDLTTTGTDDLDRTLVSYRLTDGAPGWTAPLPTGITSVQEDDHRLLGSDTAGQRTVALG